MSDFKAKCTKFDFRLGSAPDSAGGVYSAPPDPLAVFKGPTSKGRGRRGKGKGMGREKEGKGRGRRGLEGPPFCVGIGPPEGLIRHCSIMPNF